jgi:hypothetical protein
MWQRAFAVWLLIISAEAVHGVLRTLFLMPRVGDFRARQLGVLTGSVLILAIAYLCVDWIRAGTMGRLGAVGAGWVALTLTFEVSLGRLILGYSWERLLADYDVARGGLLPFGLLLMAMSPLFAAWARGRRWNEHQRNFSQAKGKTPAIRRPFDTSRRMTSRFF